MSWNIKNVKRLRAVLLKVESEKRRFDIRDVINKDICGTTACALGWYTIEYPEFAYQGRDGSPIWPDWDALGVHFLDSPTIEEANQYTSIFGATPSNGIIEEQVSALLMTTMFYGKRGADITVEDVIKKLDEIIGDVCTTQ